MLKAFDLFDKFSNEDLAIHTKSGSVITIILFVISFIVINIELAFYIKPKTYRDLSISPDGSTIDEIVNLSINVIVNMPCFFLHLDAFDQLTTQLDIQPDSSVKIRRLTHDNKLIGITEQPQTGVCQPCYGIKPPNSCCNSCEELYLLFLSNRKLPSPQNWTQCQHRYLNINHSTKNDIPASVDEKCQFKGKIKIHRIPGNFHIAVGKNIPNARGHMHDIATYFGRFDLSHDIYRLRFGSKIPQTSSPLNFFHPTPRPGVKIWYSYNLFLTPVIYKRNNQIIRRGFEYTYLLTENFIHSNYGQAPGIFFQYSFSPYTIIVTQLPRSFLLFLNSTLGLLAGAYSIAQLFDIFWRRREASSEDQTTRVRPRKTISK